MTILIRCPWILLLGVVIIGGCRVVEEPVEIQSLPSVRVKTMDEPMVIADETTPQMQARFTDPQQQSTSAVDSALLWSQKYDDLLEKNEELMEKNRKLFLENSDYQVKMKAMQEDLDNSKKQLDEANDFMGEMHKELMKWKADVLGFREEIRAAQAAQLEALSKILTVLGAEPVDASMSAGSDTAQTSQ